MSCYNNIVKFYENNGYKAYPKNLINNEFKYKLSPTGYPMNFSYFEIQKEYNYKMSKKKFSFEIHHNIAVASALNKNLYITPDISVISINSIKKLNNPNYFFSGSRGYYYVPNEKLQSFCEIKNYNPFPELLFSYIGLFHELKNEIFNKETSFQNPKHIAPSLLISGGGKYHTNLIKEELMKRYDINIFFGLFYSKNQTYSRNKMSTIKKIGSIL